MSEIILIYIIVCYILAIIGVGICSLKGFMDEQEAAFGIVIVLTAPLIIPCLICGFIITRVFM